MWQELKIKDVNQYSYRTYLDCMEDTKKTRKLSQDLKSGNDKHFLNPLILVSKLIYITY